MDPPLRRPGRLPEALYIAEEGLRRLTLGSQVSGGSLKDCPIHAGLLLRKSVKRKIRYHVVAGCPLSHSWIPGFRRLTRDSVFQPIFS